MKADLDREIRARAKAVLTKLKLTALAKHMPVNAFADVPQLTEQDGLAPQAIALAGYLQAALVMSGVVNWMKLVRAPVPDPLRLSLFYLQRAAGALGADLAEDAAAYVAKAVTARDRAPKARRSTAPGR